MHVCCMLQDHPERQRLLPLPPHGGHSERRHAGVWRKHAQRHVHEPRRQVLLLGLLGLQFGSVNTHTLTHNGQLLAPAHTWELLSSADLEGHKQSHPPDMAKSN